VENFKIKKISFLPGFIPLIRSGEKTVTRRIKYKSPGPYYFTAGRSGKKQGYLWIEKAEEIGLFESFYLMGTFGPESYIKRSEEIEKEGFTNLADFMRTWNMLVPKKYKWPKDRIQIHNDPIIWRLEFKYIGEKKPC